MRHMQQWVIICDVKWYWLLALLMSLSNKLLTCIIIALPKFRC